MARFWRNASCSEWAWLQDNITHIMFINHLAIWLGEEIEA